MTGTHAAAAEAGPEAAESAAKPPADSWIV
jgi:hypothetical protein